MTDKAKMITSNSGLVESCALLKGKPFVVVDTEFIRTDTFYPQAGLLQFSDGDNIFFVDPVEVDDFSPLIDIFEDENIVKIFHACSEDLQLFMHIFGVMPKPIFDTQIAASLLGYGASIGYLNIVKLMEGVELDKGETRSNWLQRPLTASQLHYAEQDVAFLPSIYEKLVDQLNEKQRMAWQIEDCTALLSDITELDNIESYFYKIKSLWKLDRQGLAIIKELSLWRERESRKLDRPRNHILKERCLWDIASTKPVNKQELLAIKEISSRAVRQYGDFLIDLVDEVCGRDANTYPPLQPKPLPPGEGARLKALKAAAQTVAEKLDLPVEVLMKKRDYEEYIRSGMSTGNYSAPANLSRWRKALLHDKMMGVLDS